MGDGGLGVLDGDPHAAAHPGRRTPAQLLGRGPGRVALPAGGGEGQGGEHAAGGDVAPHEAPVPSHVAAGDQEGGGERPTARRPAISRNSTTWATKVTPRSYAAGSRDHGGTLGPWSRRLRAAPKGAPNAGREWQPGIPSIREHLPSLVWGAALPIGVYFLVRAHVRTDTPALIVAGCFSAGWILLQFVRQRKVDVVGAIVLFGFAVGVVSSTLLGGNAYVLKVRDAAFTALFGVVCIVTLFTHDRPALFYVGRYFSAGATPTRCPPSTGCTSCPSGGAPSGCSRWSGASGSSSRPRSA